MRLEDIIEQYGCASYSFIAKGVERRTVKDWLSNNDASLDGWEYDYTEDQALALCTIFSIDVVDKLHFQKWHKN